MNVLDVRQVHQFVQRELAECVQVLGNHFEHEGGIARVGSYQVGLTIDRPDKRYEIGSCLRPYLLAPQHAMRYILGHLRSDFNRFFYLDMTRKDLTLVFYAAGVLGSRRPLADSVLAHLNLLWFFPTGQGMVLTARKCRR